MSDNTIDEMIALARGIIDTDGRGHVYPTHALLALEDEIEWRGLWDQYVAALAVQIGQAPCTVSLHRLIWLCICAPLDAKARAFLAAVQA